MDKIRRALWESVITIVVTLGIGAAAFGVVLGFEELVALSGVFFAIWAGLILAIHLVFAKKRRHVRLTVSVVASVLLMALHVVLFIVGVFDVDINLVPVIFLDFGMALITLMVLSLVHLVIFRRRRTGSPGSAASSPKRASLVPDVPPPHTAPVAVAPSSHDTESSQKKSVAESA